MLISALSFDLVEEAVDKSSGHGWVVAGVFAGCGVFFGGDRLIDRLGGGERKDAAGGRERVRPDDPGGAVGAAYLAAVFISNLPESISSTSGLTRGWRSRESCGCGSRSR